MDSLEQNYLTLEIPSEHARELAVGEFNESLKIAQSQSKFYTQIATVSITFVSVIVALLFKDNDNLLDVNRNFKSEYWILLLIIPFSGYVLLMYLAQIQKTIFFNQRKVITLRQVLGLDFSNLQLILPNWRVEGATNPFSIRLFPGWLSTYTLPFWFLLISLTSFLLVISPKYVIQGEFIHKYLYVSIICIIFFFGYRKNLLDKYESFFLLFVNILANIVSLKRIPNFEMIIYRAKLAVVELKRRKFEYDNILLILIAMEDQDFYTHSGYKFKSIIRGFLSCFKLFRKRNGYLKSGASTITMQLMRTLFIQSSQNKYKRKIFEILYSRWFEGNSLQGKGLSTKDLTLQMYIASVRFHKGKSGLIKASEYFFDDTKRSFSNEEAFFLIERLQNIGSGVKFQRIKFLSARLIENPLIKQQGITIDYDRLSQLYTKMIEDGKLGIQ